MSRFLRKRLAWIGLALSAVFMVPGCQSLPSQSAPNPRLGDMYDQPAYRNQGPKGWRLLLRHLNPPA
jgi:hypothetical protein